jgi:hypothetical protein
MSFCQPCRELVERHPKAARWVAFILGMSIFFTFLGQISDPVNGIGFCKIYP